MQKSPLWICLLAGSLFATESFSIKREDGTSLIGYYDQPEQAPFSIALIVPGSQKESSQRIHESLKDGLNDLHLCALTLEKKEMDDSLKQRLDDHLLLNKRLKGLIPEWNGEMVLIGQGDGGRIGAALAARALNCTALILVGSGGAWPPLQETLYSFRKEMGANGYAPGHIQSFMVQAKHEFEQALKNPTPKRKAFGYSFQYWESFLKTNIFADLTSLKCPIYAVHGSLDDRIPIESVDLLVNQLKDQITYRRKEKAGRELLRDPKTYEEAFAWLGEELTRMKDQEGFFLSN